MRCLDFGHTNPLPYPAALASGRPGGPKSAETDPEIVLPRGNPVAPQKKPPQDETQQLEFNLIRRFQENFACGGPVPRVRQRMWYVMVQATITEDGPFGPVQRIVNFWLWAYTRSYARTLARQAQAQGLKVCDITKGTISHPSHKFKRL